MILYRKTNDFTALTTEGDSFTLSNYKGHKIFLSFLRNGACALCNLRVQEIKKRYHEFESAGIKIVCVFESSVEDMKPYVGKQQVPFPLLSDPIGKFYELFNVETSQEKVNAVIASGKAHQLLEQAAAAGFPTIKQEGSNFFRMPAEFLINESFEIAIAHYSAQFDHLPLDEVLQYGLKKK